MLGCLELTQLPLTSVGKWTHEAQGKIRESKRADAEQRSERPKGQLGRDGERVDLTGLVALSAATGEEGDRLTLSLVSAWHFGVGTALLTTGEDAGGRAAPGEEARSFSLSRP